MAGGHGNDGYDEAGEEFRPGREGEERDGLEERREELRRRKEERERKEQRNRETQGARKKTKKSAGKTYEGLETSEDIELAEVVVDINIGKGRRMPARVDERTQTLVKKFLDGIFTKVQYDKIHVAESVYEGKYVISRTNKNSIYYALDKDGNFEDKKEHKELREALGERRSKRASDLDTQESRLKQKQTTRTPGEDQAEEGQGEDQAEEGRVEDQREIAAQLEAIEAEREGIIEGMSLREKVKYYFKKYGFTVVGILTAIGAVIGSILSNLKTGLAKVAKGVGNGLKD